MSDTPFVASGSVNQNVEPFPKVEQTPILPPSFSMMLLLMDSPRPVPCLWAFSLTKRSNMFLHASSLIPMPVSVTDTYIFFQSVIQFDFAIGCEFDCIGQEIGDYLCEPFRIGVKFDGG